ncbi:zonular occludens toxin domain-containing protein [Ralstonia insidiosa]|uniref:zonular occludens toxin domain-containing protein n=1 Tax=Ralstonia insidiosa TaxID=190721 RepID=UPI001ABFA8EC|nr:zonular occludens toxin domain-containing protein [Ralstonia insidiosa]
MSLSSTQPIMLITATPGGGKTALAVSVMKDAIDKGRPLFVQGVPDLKLPYIPVPPVKEWTEMRVDPEDPDERELPYFTFPENSLIVLDEAQRIFRVRSSSSAVPAHVAAFETVRHTGVTFVLMTQNPSFIDTHIRQLVGQHVHLRDVGVLGRYYYEWPECANVASFKTAPIKKKWKIPKWTFPLYKSSSLHIKRKYTMPPSLMILVACALLASVLVYRVVHSLKAKTQPSSSFEISAQAAPGAASAPVAQVKTSVPSPSSNDAAEILASFTPVVPGRPETAPAYAQLRQVKVMPRVIGVACMGQRCGAYTQQGTDAGLDQMQSRAWLANRPFDPYNDQVDAPAAPAEPVTQPAPAAVVPAEHSHMPQPVQTVSLPVETVQEPRRRTVVGSGRARRVDELEAFPEG